MGGGGAPDGCLRLQAGRVLDDLLDVDQVEQRERGFRFDLDEDIDVAVRAIVVAGP
jgi:hypothetical protein